MHFHCNNNIKKRHHADNLFYIWKFSGSWTRSGDEGSEAPQLKGAKWFSYEELKKCTNNFSVSNEIGSGGYGKVINCSVSCVKLL